MTALKELIEEFRLIRSATHTQEQYMLLSTYIHVAENYLEKEKQQLITAVGSTELGELYYNLINKQP